MWNYEEQTQMATEDKEKIKIKYNHFTRSRKMIVFDEISRI